MDAAVQTCSPLSPLASPLPPPSLNDQSLAVAGGGWGQLYRQSDGPGKPGAARAAQEISTTGLRAPSAGLLCWSPGLVSLPMYCAMYHCAHCAGCHQLSLFTSLASNVQSAATLCPGTRQKDGQSYNFRDIKMIKAVRVWWKNLSPS